MAVEEGWPRRRPHVELDREQLEGLLGAKAEGVELLSGGLRNTNYRLRLEGEVRPAVLRLYTADPAACRREAALMQLIGERVPVPRVLRMHPDADPPWTLFEWLEGDRFDQMLVRASAEEIEQSCRSAGEVLAAIHSFTFSRPGSFGPNLEIADPMGYPWLTGVEKFFAEPLARQLVGAELAEGVVRVIQHEGWRLKDVWGQSNLVHADYKPWNLLVQRTRSGWRISAALDWEFALAAPPLCDFGIFLRYADRMPPQYVSAFVDGYRRGGGTVPADVRNRARLIDLVSLWTFLERAHNEPEIVRDVAPLLAATVNAFWK